MASWWRPDARPRSFHWVLGDRINLADPVQLGLRDFNGNPLPQPEVIDIDGEFNTAADVAALHARGYKVVCYIDAGVFESYRSDASSFPRSVIGNPDSGWDGSNWLDIRQISVLRPIMVKRMTDWCKAKGFDMVEPDEIDGYSNNSGFPLTYADQLAYNRMIASEAHKLGLAVLQKGDIEQSADLQPSFDATLNEECWQYSECDLLRPYAAANKPTWIAEYKNWSATQWASICATSVSRGWVTTRFKLGLPNNGGRLPC